MHALGFESAAFIENPRWPAQLHADLVCPACLAVIPYFSLALIGQFAAMSTGVDLSTIKNGDPSATANDRATEPGA
ncbi:MAG: hypothetical protein VR73_03755 [Gammaproteobacteria bacterium BRH_c0]|nr:MAG: hypothetical protein VR73_03755 [Gammaproteobacteria bacterium BRH_c0]